MNGEWGHDDGVGTAFLSHKMLGTDRVETWWTSFKMFIKNESRLSTSRSRSFQHDNFAQIFANSETTSSMVGRLLGSSWTIRVMSDCMNLKFV